MNLASAIIIIHIIQLQLSQLILTASTRTHTPSDGEEVFLPTMTSPWKVRPSSSISCWSSPSSGGEYSGGGKVKTSTRRPIAADPFTPAKAPVPCDPKI